jgi:hypothetical protein
MRRISFRGSYRGWCLLLPHLDPNRDCSCCYSCTDTCNRIHLVWVIGGDALEETHDRLSRIMMPGVDLKVIYRVNRSMDNPDPWSIYLNKYTWKNLGTVARLTCRAWENMGIEKQITIGCLRNDEGVHVRRKEGMMYAAANHLMQDLMSDMLIHTTGYARRDLFESMLNHGLVNHSFRKRRRRRSVRRRARAPPRRGERNHLVVGRRSSGYWYGRIQLYTTILIHLEYPPPIEPSLCL